MSVSTTGSVASYIGNGVATSFAFPYLFLAASHLSVVFTDTAGNDTTVSPASYVVTGAGSPGGGTITFTIAPAVNVQVTIIRSTDDTQMVDYVFQDNFPSETHEGALDKLTVQSQDRQRLVNRAIRVTDTSPEITAMSLSQRKDSAVGFDEMGNIALDVKLGRLRALVLANPVGALPNVFDYGNLTDLNNFAADYGTII